MKNEMTIEQCIDCCKKMAFKLKNNGRLYLIDDELDTLNCVVSILENIENKKGNKVEK